MPNAYTVKTGDHLTKIAQQHGFSRWQDIYNHPSNQQFRLKRPDPNKIFPGDVIMIPDLPGKMQPQPTSPQASPTPPPPNPNRPPINLRLTPQMIEKIIRDSEMQRMLKGLPPTMPSKSVLDGIFEKYKGYLEPTVGDWKIKPDYKLLWDTLMDLKGQIK
jgi:hypothetical protein